MSHIRKSIRLGVRLTRSVNPSMTKPIVRLTESDMLNNIRKREHIASNKIKLGEKLIRSITLIIEERVSMASHGMSGICFMITRTDSALSVV